MSSGAACLVERPACRCRYFTCISCIRSMAWPINGLVRQIACPLHQHKTVFKSIGFERTFLLANEPTARREWFNYSINAIRGRWVEMGLEWKIATVWLYSASQAATGGTFTSRRAESETDNWYLRLCLLGTLRFRLLFFHCGRSRAIRDKNDCEPVASSRWSERVGVVWMLVWCIHFDGGGGGVMHAMQYELYACDVRCTRQFEMVNTRWRWARKIHKYRLDGSLFSTSQLRTMTAHSCHAWSEWHCDDFRRYGVVFCNLNANVQVIQGDLCVKRAVAAAANA